MPIRDDHSTDKSATPSEGDDLLRRRMTILDLDIAAIERDHGAIFEELRRHCLSCRDRAPCAVDLRRDPDGLVWEAYCPNSGELIALVTLAEASR